MQMNAAETRQDATARRFHPALAWGESVGHTHRPAGRQVLQLLAQLLDWAVGAVSELFVTHRADRGQPCREVG